MVEPAKAPILGWQAAMEPEEVHPGTKPEVMGSLRSAPQSLLGKIGVAATNKCRGGIRGAVVTAGQNAQWMLPPGIGEKRVKARARPSGSRSSRMDGSKWR